MGRNQALGRYGEDVACRHLIDAGLQVLERNWRCKEGEIDIVSLASITWQPLLWSSWVYPGIDSTLGNFMKARKRWLSSADMATEPCTQSVKAMVPPGLTRRAAS